MMVDTLDVFKDSAVRAGRFQAKIDKMGFGDPLKKENAALRAALRDVANALADTMTTLDSVDPNAPSLEAAEIVMEKHIRIVGPLIEEARKEKG